MNRLHEDLISALSELYLFNQRSDLDQVPHKQQWHDLDDIDFILF